MEIRFRDDTPFERIRRLGESGLSVAKIAAETGTTPAVVRRVVGKRDNASVRERQEATAKRIVAEGGSWSEKAAKWKVETGKSPVTMWRVLKRCGGMSN
jgi:hypothetical protein